MFEGAVAKRIVGVSLALALAGCGGAVGGNPDAGAPDAAEEVDAGDAGSFDAGAPCDLARCDAPTPVCEPSSGECVECLQDLHCPDARPACDEASHACVVCAADSDCPAATPHCDVEIPGGLCVGCRSDDDCGGATPTCDPTSRQCVGDGDACVSSKVLMPSVDAPVTVTVDTTALNDDTAGFCSSAKPGGNHEGVFRFTLAEPHEVIIQAKAAAGTDVDPLLYLRAGSCDGPETACVDRTAAGSSELLVLHALPAGDYFLFVEAFGEAQGSIEVTITLPDGPPANDTCAGAQPLAATEGTQTVTFTTFAAADETDSSCGETAQSPEGVYVLTLSDPLILDVAATAEEGVIPTVFLRDETCAGAELACATLDDEQAAFSAPLPPGTYFLFVETDASGLPGAVSVDVTLRSAPAGESCALPGQLNLPTGGSTQFTIDTTMAADEELSPYCSYSNSPDLVYALTLTDPQDVTVVATPPSGSGADAILWARSGSCGASTGEVGCVDQEWDGYPETLLLQNLQPGTYFLFFETYNGYAGALDVSITLSPPTVPAPESCMTALDLGLAPGGSTSFQVDTSVASDDHGGYVCGSFGAEYVYKVTLTQTQTISFTATAPAGSFADPVLYLREGTCLGGTEVDCVDTIGNTDTLTAANLPPGDYFLFVETYEVDDGLLDVTVQLSP